MVHHIPQTTQLRVNPEVGGVDLMQYYFDQRIILAVNLYKLRLYLHLYPRRHVDGVIVELCSVHNLQPLLLTGEAREEEWGEDHGLHHPEQRRPVHQERSVNYLEKGL